MNFIHLRTFIVTAEESSFSNAARRLYLSAPALTQQINQLEKELGFSLFHRTYNGISLTKAGKEFYSGAKQVCMMMDKTIKQATAEANGESVIRLSITNPEYAKTIKKFELLYPQVHIQHIEIPYDGMEYGLESLSNREIDVYETEYTSKIFQYGCSFKKTRETYLCAFVSYRHPLASRTSITLEDLENEHVIIYQYLFSANESLNKIGFKHMQVINIRSSWTDIMNATEKGSVYLLEYETANNLCPYGALVKLDPEIKIEYGLVYNEDHPLANKFIELL